MNRIPCAGFSDKHIYFPNAPPCMQCHLLNADFTRRIFMYEKYFEQLKEECLIRNRSSRTSEAYIANIKVFMKWLIGLIVLFGTLLNPSFVEFLKIFIK